MSIFCGSITLNKKILLIAGMTFILTGAVSASSINGNYKGNPIVKINSNGTEISPEDVPAFIYDNSTVVPISVLRKLGASVSWNAETYSVDVSTTDSIVKQLFDANVITSGEKRYFTYSEPYLMLQSDIDFLTGDNAKVLDTLIHVTSNTDASVIKVTFMNKPREAVAQILFDTSDARAYSKGEISLEQMVDQINVAVNYFPVKEIKVSIGSKGGQVQTPTPKSTPTPTSNTAVTPSVIESKIDGDFEGYDSDNVYKLMNGQIWRQTSYQYNYHYSFMPNVIIYSSGGVYKMKVDGMDDAITVERLK